MKSGSDERRRGLMTRTNHPVHQTGIVIGGSVGTVF